MVMRFQMIGFHPWYENKRVPFNQVDSCFLAHFPLYPAFKPVQMTTEEAGNGAKN